MTHPTWPALTLAILGRVDREPPRAATNYAGITLASGATGNIVRGNTVLHHTLDGIVVHFGATENVVQGNTARENMPYDAEDENPNCDANTWKENNFGAVNPACVR